jgi:hypothetical protein
MTGKSLRGWLGKYSSMPVGEKQGDKLRELKETIPGEPRTTTVKEDLGKVVQATVLGPDRNEWCYVEYPSENMKFYARYSDVQEWEKAAEESSPST